METLQVNGQFGRRVLVDDVYGALKAMLMDQRLQPGSKIGVDQLVRDLDVSSTPIREALARLESDGLVTKEPLRGFFAKPQITQAEFCDLCDFRRALEGWTAARAAELMTPEAAVRLQKEMDRGVPPPVSGDYESYRPFQEHDERFHGIIFEIAGNRTAHQAFLRVYPHLRTYRARFEARAGQAAYSEHRLIFEALVAGDAAAAREAIIGHINQTEARLLPYLEGSST